MDRLKETYLYVWDRISFMLGNGNSLVPPQKLVNAVGGGDYTAIGNQFLQYFIKNGGLAPDHRVLDVGCGCGRMAVPLMKYLSPNASYEGFDIMRIGIDWCQRHIARQDSRFSFKLANIYNKSYNPRGKVQPSEFVFPYPDASFDFVFLTSVFTHMLSADMRHYVSEISRVLKPNGRCVASFFILNQESKQLMDAGRSAFQLPFAQPDCMVLREDQPENTVGYDEEIVRQCFAANGIKPIDPIYFGSWAGRASYLTYQDLFVAQKVS